MSSSKISLVKFCAIGVKSDENLIESVFMTIVSMRACISASSSEFTKFVLILNVRHSPFYALQKVVLWDSTLRFNRFSHFYYIKHDRMYGAQNKLMYRATRDQHLVASFI